MFKLGLIGYPLGHSLSPSIHATLLGLAGLEGAYDAIDTPPDALPHQLESLCALGYLGWNVTIPHKLAAARWVDRLTPEAERIGAVNTVRVDPETGERVGHNTDGIGYRLSLPAVVQGDLPLRPTVLLGAGGGARSLVATLVEARVPSLTLLVREPDKHRATLDWAQALAARADSPTMVALAPLAAEAEVRVALAAAALLVNTTPVGLWPEVDATPLPAEWLDALPATALVSDIVYRPLETRLLMEARLRGLSVHTGLGMLMYQAFQAFTFWTGIPVQAAWIRQVETRLLLELADSDPTATA